MVRRLRNGGSAKRPVRATRSRTTSKVGRDGPERVFAGNLLRLCNARHMTTAALAKRIGRRPDVIERLCTSEASPTLKLITSIANALDVSLDELLRGL